MSREGEDVVGRLLASCSALLCDDGGPLGTAFFVAPGYAITAAHVAKVEGRRVRLAEGTSDWPGRVTDVRPPRPSVAAGAKPHPAPDLALITIDGGGPPHACALLGEGLPEMRTWVMTRGYTQAFDHEAVVAETETFHLSGTLETPDTGCTLLKLGLGEVTKGMSGAPVISFLTGHVIGLLRTSRQPGSNLGGWVVPADLIRQLWPEEISQGDLFHQQDGSWREQVRQLREGSRPRREPPSGPVVGTMIADVAQVITGGEIGSINIQNRSGLAQRRAPETS